MSSKIRLTKVSENHYVSKLDLEKLPKGAYKFSKQLKDQDVEADNTIIATYEGELIGYFRYGRYDKIVYGCGTWVQANHRRKGLASRMWKFMVSKEKPKAIHVITSSRYGAKLVDSLTKIAEIDHLPNW